LCKDGLKQTNGSVINERIGLWDEGRNDELETEEPITNGLRWFFFFFRIPRDQFGRNTDERRRRKKKKKCYQEKDHVGWVLSQRLQKEKEKKKKKIKNKKMWGEEEKSGNEGGRRWVECQMSYLDKLEEHRE
jgi:hypothetical protein